MKNVTRILSFICALALIVAGFAPSSVKAETGANVKVDKVYEIMARLNADETDYIKKEFSKTVEFAGGKLNYTASRIMFYSNSDKDAAKKLNKAIKKAANKDALQYYINLFEENGYEAGDNLVMNVDVNNISFSRQGNILSLMFNVTAGYETSAYPVTLVKICNINLNNGKRIKNISSIIADEDGFKQEVLSEVKSQIEDMKNDKEAEYGLFDEIDDEAILNEIILRNIDFFYRGAQLIINEGVIGPHAAGPNGFSIPQEVIDKYFKTGKYQLIRPLSSSVICFDEERGGSYWNCDFISGDNVVVLNNDWYIPEKMYKLPADGDAYTHAFYFKAVNPGTAEIQLTKYNASGDKELDHMNITVNVNEDLFFFEVNSEG